MNHILHQHNDLSAYISCISTLSQKSPKECKIRIKSTSHTLGRWDQRSMKDEKKERNYNFCSPALLLYYYR